VKKEFRLDEAIKEKESLIEDLKTINENIQRENQMPINIERSFDIPKLVKQADLLRTNLINIKLKIQEANNTPREKVGDVSYSLQRYIFELSELKVQRQNLLKLPTRNDSTRTCVITRGNVDTLVQNLNKQIRAFEAKLTDLNHSIVITIEDYNDLTV
jgi:hypothetical protein